jgi:hypothetical protein
MDWFRIICFKFSFKNLEEDLASQVFVESISKSFRSFAGVLGVRKPVITIFTFLKEFPPIRSNKSTPLMSGSPTSTKAAVVVLFSKFFFRFFA